MEMKDLLAIIPLLGFIAALIVIFNPPILGNVLTARLFIFIPGLLGLIIGPYLVIDALKNKNGIRLFLGIIGLLLAQFSLMKSESMSFIIGSITVFIIFILVILLLSVLAYKYKEYKKWLIFAIILILLQNIFILIEKFVSLAPI